MNVYYIAGFPITDELYHYGVKGQSWGSRRFQNPDGSLTALGRQHYGVGPPIQGGSAPLNTQPLARRQSNTQYNKQSGGGAGRADVVNRSSQVNTNINARQGYRQIANTNTRSTPTQRNTSYIPTYGSTQTSTREKALSSSFSEMDHISSWLSETDDVLKKGSKSKKDVEALQRALQALGYDLSKFGVDGKFGSETQAALNAFKRDMGMKETGVLDYETSRVLQGALEDNIRAERRTNVQAQNQNRISIPQQTASEQPQVNNSAPQQTNIQGETEEEDEEEKKTSVPTTKKEIKSRESNGKKRSQEILDSLESSGKQIADQHKRVSDAMSKASNSVGKAMSEAAKNTGKAISEAITGIKDAHKSLTGTLATTSKKRAKMYEAITLAANAVRVSAVSVDKSVRNAADKIIQQNNTLVSELTGLSKTVSKSVEDVSKKVKKTDNSISNFLRGAKNTVNKGSNVVKKLFGR